MAQTVMTQTWIKLVSGNEAAAVIGAQGEHGAEHGAHSGPDSAATDLLVSACLAAAAGGDNDALFDLGVAYSTGSHGAPCDLIEAHKWFNLAAVGGHDEAAQCRADVSEDMTAREIAEAQRRAREWLRAAKPDMRAA